MDLVPGEVKSLKSMVEEWHKHPERELETTFGENGEVDTTTFLNIVQRLKSKGYDALPQEDKLNICTPNGARFSLYGMGVISQFCRDNIIAGKPYQAIIKDKASGESNLDLDEYNVRVKTRREIPLSPEDPQLKEILARWPNQKKAFRMIRRWTFRGNGIRFDLSMVRSTPQKRFRDQTGKERKEFQWALGFRDFNFLEVAPVYEVEVELLHSEEPLETHVKNLVRGIGEVLRGIQKNTLLTRKTIKAKVINDYMRLAGLGTQRKFRGVAPKTLQLANMQKVPEPNVPNLRGEGGYNVTDKADGLRVHAFCTDEGDLWLIDMGLNVYRTGFRRVACANTLLDGEWVTKSKDGTAIQHLLLFDVYIGLGGKKVTQLPFYTPPVAATEVNKETRHAALELWTRTWNEGDGPEAKASGMIAATNLNISNKVFLFGSAGDDSIFKAAARILDTKRIYSTDGLIFTANKASLPEKPSGVFDKQFKWKPAEDNTIDFLVITEKDPDNDKIDKVTIGVHPETGQTVRYKTLRLLVGSSRDAAYDDPRATILRELPLPGARPGDRKEYKPIIFNPSSYTDLMASVCYREVQTDPDTEEEFVKCDRSGEPIQDSSIVEMAYEPSEEPGWRWVPIRVRYDKTERFQRGQIERTLNSEMVANDNWNSIYDPITESMIRTGREEATIEEISDIKKIIAASEDIERKYYNRKGEKDDKRFVKGLTDFHNKWVKERILIQTALKGGGKSLLDITCGRGGDLQKWRRAGVSFVLGIDKAGSCILDPTDGAYRRLLDTWLRNGRDNIPPMIFVIGDSSKSLVNGSAGATPEEQAILRSVLGKYPAGGDIPPLVAKTGAGILKGGADAVSCNFAIHYFFETADIFEGFLENIRETLKIGGYFTGCCFDGETTFNFLRGTDTGGSRSGVEKDGTVIWSITKNYEADDLPVDDEAFGMPIDVKFISIGMEHTEYLVPFKLLVEKMKLIGCELLNDEELAEAGLLHSTNLFSNSYDMATKAKPPMVFPMSDVVKDFSFLNRWFIFKRRSEGLGVDGEEVAEAAASAKATEEDEGSVVRALAGKSEPYKKGYQDAVTALAVKPNALPEVAKELEGDERRGFEAAIASATAKKPTAILPAAASAPRPEEGDVGAAAAAADDARRTVPVEMAGKKNTYQPAELFQFFHGAALKDTLAIGKKGAARYLAPSAPFRILDPDDPSIEYPTVEHYMAAMKYKLATNKPDLAVKLFSRTGQIHQEFVRIRLGETGAGKRLLPEDRDYELLNDEREKVLDEARPPVIRRYGATFDEAKWMSVKENALREALTQRYTKDKEFQDIVNAVRAKGKYLLYYSTAADGLGGVRRADGRIDGENKVGKIIMELAGFS